MTDTKLIKIKYTLACIVFKLVVFLETYLNNQAMKF